MDGKVEEFLEQKRRDLEGPIKLLMDSQKQTIAITPMYQRTLNMLKEINPENPTSICEHFRVL